MLFDVVIPKDEKIKMIVAGSISFDDHVLLAKEINKFIREIGVREIEVLSGGEPGASLLGQYYANHYKQDCTVIQADWGNDGEAADYKRDEKLAEIADACIVFWDGHDKTTLNMINISKRYKLKLKIIEYDKGN